MLDKDAFRECLRRVTEDANAFHALTEAGDHILPWLEAEFREEPSPERAAVIVEIIWEHRNPESFAFLVEALSDPAEAVWQEALNGMVAIGGCAARTLLQLALAESDLKKREWIIEAIEQVEERI